MGLIQCVWCPLITKEYETPRVQAHREQAKQGWRKKAKLTTRQEGRPRRTSSLRNSETTLMKTPVPTKPSRELWLEYLLAYTTLAFLTLGITVICIYLYKFDNIFVQTLSHRTVFQPSSPPSAPLSTAPVWTPALLGVTGAVLETLLICSAGWIVHTCFYLLFFFFLVFVLFFWSSCNISPKKRFIDLGCKFASLCMFGNFLIFSITLIDDFT